MKKIYVGNLPFQASEESLRDWFTSAGFTVSSINLIRDRFSGEPRGFGFVEINDDTEALNAIQALHGKDFLGRTLVVNEARPLRERGGGGDDRHRGGGGGERGRGRRSW